MVLHKGVAMSQLFLNPYINFRGKAHEAFTFYQQVLGGKLDLLTFSPDGPPKPAGPEDSIMHARLESDGAIIMGTDGSPDYPPTVGDNFAVALGGTDVARLTKVFEQLGEGGNVKQPLKEESWGDTFGWLEDKFGINWMVNISKSES
jgi:PhnB protein